MVINMIMEMMMITIASFCLLSSGVVVVVHGACGTFVASDGTPYNNLAYLTAKTSYNVSEPTTGTPYLYIYNYCSEITTPSPVGIPSSAAQCGMNGAGNCVALGALNYTIGDHPNGPKMGVAITYEPNTFNSKCMGGSVARTVKQFINCNPDVQHRLVSLVEVSTCQYVFTSDSSSACPGKPIPVHGCGTYKASDGSLYGDLNALTSTTEDYTSGKSSSALYTWNFCRDVAPSSCLLPAPATRTLLNNCDQLGYTSHTLFNDHPLGPRFGVNITYEDVFTPPLCSGSTRSVSLVVECDPAQEYNLTSISSNTCGQYNINMRSSYACATNAPYPPPSSCGKYVSGNGTIGYTYDLTNLTSYADYTITTAPNDNTRFYWNFCSVLTSKLSPSCSSQPSYIVKDASSIGRGCSVLGNASNKFVVNDHPSGPASGVYIAYKGTTPDCPNYLANIVATCDVQETRFVRVVEYTCRSDIYMTSKYACPL
eukprot:TRINITY_DN14286_c0_g2_i1.p1 TRINITY_DN14286_c0_g2~~TRINITY_DN14286_c0_g2_i1.p1  ORF type:complete len:483 (-),score=68.88 TRINITY_DN14286_c0_g2_i1:279-1727(-)